MSPALRKLLDAAKIYLDKSSGLESRRELLYEAIAEVELEERVAAERGPVEGDAADTTTFRAEFIGTDPGKLPALRRCEHPIAIFASDPELRGCGDELRIPVTCADAIALHLLASGVERLDVEMTLTWRLR